jgi:hypothetical protein
VVRTLIETARFVNSDDDYGRLTAPGCASRPS